MKHRKMFPYVFLKLPRVKVRGMKILNLRCVLHARNFLDTLPGLIQYVIINKHEEIHNRNQQGTKGILEIIKIHDMWPIRHSPRTRVEV